MQIVQSNGVILPYGASKTYNAIYADLPINPAEIVWSATNTGANYISYSNDEGGSIVITNNNTTGEKLVVTLWAKVDNYVAVCSFYLLPDETPPVIVPVTMTVPESNGATIASGDSKTFSAITTGITNLSEITWTLTNSGAGKAGLVNNGDGTVTITNNNNTANRLAVTLTIRYDDITIVKSFYLAPGA